MTKFEELCAAYKSAQHEFKQFKDDCHNFALELWNNLITYFQIPPSQLTLYRVNEEGEFEATAPPMINAITLWPDAYWRVGFGITLYEAKNSYPQETVIIGLHLKRDTNNNYIVRINEKEQEFIIDRKNVVDFQKFYDYLYTEIQKSYTTGLQTFIDQETTIRRIGFKLDNDTEETEASL